MTQGLGEHRDPLKLTDDGGVESGSLNAAHPVEFETQDGVILRGEARGEGPRWVLLVHDIGDDLDVWDSLTPDLLAEGFGVVSLDLRGHGASEGVANPRMVVSDLRSTVSALHLGRGNRLGFVATGLGATACLELAAAASAQAVVALSPRRLEPDFDRIRSSACPKLIMVGSLNTDFLVESSLFQRACLGWTLLREFPTAKQGADLLQSSWGDHVREEVLAFLKSYLAAGVIVE